MLFVSLFLTGFTVGVLVTMFIFRPERDEETWDPQYFVPRTSLDTDKTTSSSASLIQSVSQI